MADIQEILGRQINSVKELKSAIKELQNSLLLLDEDSKEYKETTTKLVAAQEVLRKTTKAGAQENAEAADSVYGLQKQYRDLYNEYKKLTEAERNSPFGKNMAYELRQLSEQINDTKKGVGDFTANIGHYADDITKAFSSMGISVGALQTPLKLATAGSKGLNDAWKALTKNPWLTAITVLIGILAKAAEKIKENKELTERLHNALAVFQPILDAISNAFNLLAEGIVKATEKFANFIAKFAGPKAREAIQNTRDMAAAQRELNAANREAAEADANEALKGDVSRYKELANLAGTAAEKQDYINKAKEKQLELDNNLVAAAEKAYADFEKRYSGDDVYKPLKEQERLLAEIDLATRNRAENQQKLDDIIKNSAKGATTAVKEYTETVDSAKTAAEEIYKRTVEASKSEVQKLYEKYMTEYALLKEYNQDTTLLTEQFLARMKEIKDKAAEEDIKRAQETQNYLDNMLENSVQTSIEGFEQLREIQTETKLTILDTLNSITSSLGSMLSAIQNVIEADLNSGKITEEQAERKKKALKALQAVELAVTIAGIAADTASGIMSIKANHSAYEAAQLAKYALVPGGEAIAGGKIAASKTMANLNIASLVTAGAANIAAAVGGYIAKGKSLSSSDGGGISGAATTIPEVAQPEPYRYTRNVQTVEDIDYLNQQPIYVKVTDIDNAQGKMVKVAEETTF